eukprot:6199239-Pleurochrysis_carterae.AAC.1
MLCAPARPQQKTIPHRSNFSLAADLLEISACVALSRGSVLSSAWNLANASMFWLLHAGLIALPGQFAASGYGVYRTDAILLCARDTQARRSHACP